MKANDTPTKLVLKHLKASGQVEVAIGSDCYKAAERMKYENVLKPVKYTFLTATYKAVTP
jgi:hypothetical protein